MILAHGAGSAMDSPFLSTVHAGLAAAGHECVKFNFPYATAGRRAPDRAPKLEACFRAVLEHVRGTRRSAGTRFVLGGKSMGGRIATHLAAAGAPCNGLLLLGYPLHPPGKPDALRVAHFPQILTPSLFFAGTRDPLSRLDLLRASLPALAGPWQMHLVEGGDHSLAVPKRQGKSHAEILAEVVHRSDAWLRDLSGA